MSIAQNIPELPMRCIVAALIVSLLLPRSAWTNDEVIRNMTVQFDGRVVEIRYDLIVPDRTNGRYTVTLHISDDRGRTYDVTPRMMAGDIGRDITAGMNKRIVWIIEREFPTEIDIARYDFRLTAKRQGFNRNILYALLGAVVAGGGTAAYFILGGADESGFPKPPGRPE